MCGRFVIFSPYDIIKESFDIGDSGAQLTPNYNVCPTQPIAAVFTDGRTRVLSFMHWGLVPSWAKDTSGAARLINARAETLSEKPSFRNAFKKRRCLIPADGYYEWSGEKGRKQPHYIRPKTGRLFAFAGLWERWIDKASPEAPAFISCAIVTTGAGPSIRSIHDRMPLILMPEYYAAWLNPKTEDAGELKRILQSGAIREVAHYPVSKAVNSVKNNGPGLIRESTPTDGLSP